MRKIGHSKLEIKRVASARRVALKDIRDFFKEEGKKIVEQEAWEKKDNRYWGLLAERGNCHKKPKKKNAA